MKEALEKKATKNIQASYVLMRQKLYCSAANRSYYAVLNASVSYFLGRELTEDSLKRIKIHEEINRLLLNCDEKLGDDFFMCKSIRVKADYHKFKVKDNEARRVQAFYRKVTAFFLEQKGKS